MVDCIGVVICQQQAIADVLTADNDFAQEGLTVLLA
jgi:predicted nucleic acid-binding protein